MQRFVAVLLRVLVATVGTFVYFPRQVQVASADFKVQVRPAPARELSLEVVLKYFFSFAIHIHEEQVPLIHIQLKAFANT